MVSVLVSSYGCMQIAKHERSISVYAQVVEMPAANNILRAPVTQMIIGSLRSYDGNYKENVTLKLNFALS